MGTGRRLGEQAVAEKGVGGMVLGYRGYVEAALSGMEGPHFPLS